MLGRRAVIAAASSLSSSPLVSKITQNIIGRATATATATMATMMPTSSLSASMSSSSSLNNSPNGPFLSDKTAIVTGGSGTIGRAIARALLWNGSCRHVVLTARNLDRLRAAQEGVLAFDENCNISDKGSCSIIASDVTNEASAQELFDTVEQQFGGVDLLINNAGIMGDGLPTKDTESSQNFANVMQVNVVGPFTCARLAMQSFLRREKKQGKEMGGGRIINICSIASISPRPHSAAYTTSKFAIRGLTQSLALDGRDHNIAVGMIHPGNVLSNIMSEEEAAHRQATEGFISPDDVAHCVLTMAQMPYSANVLELSVMPLQQPLVGRG